MSPLTSFRHIAASLRLHFGADCLGQLRPEIERLGLKRAVVFCGGTLARAPEGLARVAAVLGGTFAGAFDRVMPHSPLPVVAEAARFLDETAPDAVIALGGGSVAVTARIASILHGEQRPPADLCTRFRPGEPPVSPRLSAPKPAQFVIATTPTTASAKAGGSVFDPVAGRRLTFFDPRLRAEAIFLEPDLACDVPVPVFRDAALNSLALTVQGLESPRREPLADALLLHGVRLLLSDLPLLGTARDGTEVRGKLLQASILAARGTDHVGAGLTTALGHCLGIRSHLPNGATNAVLLPHGIRFNAGATGDRLAELAEMLGLAPTAAAAAPALVAAEGLERFFCSLGLPGGLAALGIEPGIFGQVAEDAFQDWFLHQNPRPVLDRAELLALLEEAA